MGKGIEKSAYTLAGTEKKRKQDEKKIETFLSQGHSNGIMPLPTLKKIIPLMAADLQDLQLVPVDIIGIPESLGAVEYVRVTSLDSPFREMVSWAYLQIVGRPGLPNRNFREWKKKNLEEYKEERGT